VQRGHVYLKTGKRARFEYLSPQVFTEYYDKNFTRYVPEIEQAHQFPINQAESDVLAIIQVVGNRETSWKNYFAEYHETLGVPGSNRVIRLVPKNKDLKSVEIEVDPTTYFIVRMVITAVNGLRNEFKFTNIKTAPLADSLFKLSRHLESRS
jgi:outer membrane lipoprotein-sorting protein